MSDRRRELLKRNESLVGVGRDRRTRKPEVDGEPHSTDDTRATGGGCRGEAGHPGTFASVSAVKQVVLRGGHPAVVDIPAPSPEPGRLVVANAASVISSGTERSAVAT